jgi:putative hydrolase of the HAD superfamily
VAAALARVGIEIDPAAVPGAHYRAVRWLDADSRRRRPPDAYPRALCSALGVAGEPTRAAVQALARLGDRTRSDRVLWSEETSGAFSTIAELRRRGIAVVIVTNSDGHAAENLREAGLDPGIEVIDSRLVGSAKPDRGIFRLALARVGASAGAVVHVGDMLSSDIRGARAAGIEPIHFDPGRVCRARDHRHVRSLRGIWRHVSPLPGRTPRLRARPAAIPLALVSVARPR